jgi:hypothetical protein
MCIPFNNSPTLKYPNQESILPRFVDKGSILLMYMQILVAIITLLFPIRPCQFLIKRKQVSPHRRKLIYVCTRNFATLFPLSQEQITVHIFIFLYRHYFLHAILQMWVIQHVCVCVCGCIACVLLYISFYASKNKRIACNIEIM